MKDELNKKMGCSSLGNGVGLFFSAGDFNNGVRTPVLGNGVR
jgi:hypothetical protein